MKDTPYMVERNNMIVEELLEDGKTVSITCHEELQRYVESGVISEDDLRHIEVRYGAYQDAGAKLEHAVHDIKTYKGFPLEYRMRKLFNRMVGNKMGYTPYLVDALGTAMDEHKESWVNAYNSFDEVGMDRAYQMMYEVLLDISDTLQEHGHGGVWGDLPTPEKFEEARQYRSMFHDDKDVAYNEEFYSVLLGYW